MSRLREQYDEIKKQRETSPLKISFFTPQHRKIGTKSALDQHFSRDNKSVRISHIPSRGAVTPQIFESNYQTNGGRFVVQSSNIITASQSKIIEGERSPNSFTKQYQSTQRLHTRGLTRRAYLSTYETSAVYSENQHTGVKADSYINQSMRSSACTPDCSLDSPFELLQAQINQVGDLA